ncbi:L-fucose:H+ symporter permease [Asticcacaulis sp. EMRT-3]|uniref:L-fucose:H+ symporter permease n=1 Tax=Asticcacaulis sp. EMRT-3 TaxID=3040349 RepID=UPI0024AECC61|nr:L-fucose:H+ symporter permease [Asticcacaulis sp. EMRT-3]MDI7775293.1 L-fucose:H+ symporter permease [Asticcacaulis sp. EMRT-3]
MTTDETAPKGFKAFWPVILITALFFFWGVANNLNDILIPQFKKAFDLSNLQSSLVQSAFYMGYFLFALPAGFLMRRFGYKAAVLTGLCLYALGALLFWPAAEVRQYPFFLGALFVIASGLAFLETSANPLMTVLGSEKGAAFRLNLAQAFNPLGSLAGIWIGKTFILSGIEKMSSTADYVREAKAVQIPYLVIGLAVLVWAGLVALNRFPKAATDDDSKGAIHDHDEAQLSPWQAVSGLFKYRHFLLGVAAQFFYVGAQVGIWSYVIKYGQSELHMIDKTAANYLTYALTAFLIGRFAGTALMSVINPARLLTGFAVINIGLAAVAVFVGGQTGLWALVAASFFMSIMYPTIFATAVRGLGPLTKTGSSLLVMAIVGGFILTNLMGYILDHGSARLAIIVPLACFGVVALYGLTTPKLAGKPEMVAA